MKGLWKNLLPLPFRVAYEKATEPTQAAKEAFSEMAFRWVALDSWGWRDKVPSIHVQYDSWVPFRDAWTAGDRDTAGLQGRSSELWIAEQVAGEYRGKGGPYPRPAAPVSVPGVVDSTIATATARAIDEAAPPGPGSPKPVPLWAYALGGLVALGTVGYTLGVVRSFLPRIAGKDERRS